MTWLTTWITECFQESGLDGFGEQRSLDQLQLKIIAGNRQQIPNARIVRRNIDGFVLSATLGVPENNDNDIFHPTRNPRTVMIDTSIFDHNPICLKVEAPADNANGDPKPGPSGQQQDQGKTV